MEKFNKSLPMMLHRALDAVIPQYRKVFKEHDISEQQWRILRVLWEIENCTTAELAQQTLLPSPSMVGIIDRMINKGLVVRDRSESDRRIVYVSLTKKGEALEKVLMPKADETYARMLEQCDSQSWQTMMNTLQLIIDTNRSDSKRRSTKARR